MEEVHSSRMQVANTLRTFLVCSLGTFTKLAQYMFLQYQLRIFSQYCLVMFPQHQVGMFAKISKYHIRWEHTGDFRKESSGNVKGMFIVAWEVVNFVNVINVNLYFLYICMTK